MARVDSLKYRAQARLAIAVARVLILLSPDRLAAVLTRLCRGVAQASATDAGDARDVVCALSRRCAGQGCLQRSVAVVILCRLRGSAPDWCAGFAMHPFTAHAWVEVDDRPVGEPEKVSTYTVVHASRVRPHQARSRS
ncbi:lasso peptide biosynthesis B2 protein [Microbispora sitophila]|uniref:lasso peptide biosynthesis B2 protein n=1 Tax=Microbispora sitophila TaxID=2771537 RepID=UPI001D01DC2E|nr:lasso peptide biosynthesis B2 protein [Microbispora sitophila]